MHTNNSLYRLILIPTDILTNFRILTVAYTNTVYTDTDIRNISTNTLVLALEFTNYTDNTDYWSCPTTTGPRSSS